MIQLQNVTKRIKENTVLDNVSYTFKSGFVYGLYGQNGSGKTMLLRAISGLINLDSGSIFIDGEKLHDKIEFPPETGIVIENMELLPECSAKRNLQMLAKIKNIADEKDIIFSLERVGLDPDSDKKVKKFSLGMKQRLNIAQAIFENQKIILLDEPTNALALAEKYDVRMPIIEEVNRVLFEDKPAKEAVSELMLRDRKIEHSSLEWK